MVKFLKNFLQENIYPSNNLKIKGADTALLNNVYESSVDEIEYIERLILDQIKQFENNYLSRSVSELNPWWEFIRTDPYIRFECRKFPSEFISKTYSTLLRSERVVFIPSRDVDVMLAIRIPYLNRRLFCRFEVYNNNYEKIYKGPTVQLTAYENIQYINNGKPVFQRLIQDQENTIAIHFLDEQHTIPHTFEIIGLTFRKKEKSVITGKQNEKFKLENIDKNYRDRELLLKYPSKRHVFKFTENNLIDVDYLENKTYNGTINDE